jgi:lipopolysaccharide/colanic/teichoic acid biosynthesis glycosyltransferase
MVGGMSSLFFDKVPDPGEVPVSVHRPTRVAERRNKSLPFVVGEERMLSDASGWAMSAVRRTLECAAAAVALLLLMPVLLFAALLVRLDSRGPILFRQRRMGRNGREFILYKFRSMRAEAEEQSCITVSGDPRITRAGAFLRRHKLDELPQFWNVLRGDMALVGPRPKLPHHEALHMTYRPGITGVATLAFQNEEELLARIPDHQLDEFYDRYIKPAKATLDLEYMRTATFRSDAHILWRTFGACLTRTGEGPAEPDPLTETAQSIVEYAMMAPSPES